MSLWSSLNWITLGVLPWWSWLVFGGLAYAAVMYFVPVPKLNNALALAIAVLLSGVGIKAWGYQEGEAHKEAEWVARVDLERQALMARIRVLENTESARAAEAEASTEQYTRTTDDILTAVRGRNAPAISEPVARQLYNDANGNGLIRRAPP